MKTKKVVINKLSRGEIYGAMRLMKLGALLPLVRNQLENNLEYADLSFEDRIGTILYEARSSFCGDNLSEFTATEVIPSLWEQ